jgi:long-chain acyl-CoA synthetase
VRHQRYSGALCEPVASRLHDHKELLPLVLRLAAAMRAGFRHVGDAPSGAVEYFDREGMSGVLGIPTPGVGATTLCTVFQQTAARYAEKVALRTPDDEVSLTWREYGERVERIAAGLQALGVTRGETMGIMLVNRPEFNLVDTAALHLGATPFSLYNSSAVEQIAHLLENASNRVVVTERDFLPTIQAAMAAGGEVEHVVLVDDAQEGTIPLEQLETLGEPEFDFEATWRAVGPNDVATLIYTSGTTGPPKGVQLTHASLLAEVRAMHERLPATPGGRTISYLPCAHIADRWYHHYHCSMALGFTVTCVADPRTIAAHLPEVKPTAWGGVPRVWEKIKASLEAQGITEPAALPDEQRAAIRAKLGLDECDWLIVGGAPTSPEVLHYFLDLGLPVCELFGMSETSCVVICNPPDRIKIGTCGTVVPGVELDLAEDGELLVRGEMIMAGYRGDPQRTREAIDENGWLHTGDIAKIDEDGYVTIVDRKKELIINAAGKNMSPANIEAELKASHPLIGQAVTIGDGRPYNCALIVLDPDVCAAFVRDRGIERATPAALACDEGVQGAVAAAVADANTRLSRVEQIKRHTIIAGDWEPGGDELTPTMKLRRKSIAEKYAVEIEALYA